MAEKTKIIKIQSKLPSMQCESFLIEDSKQVWVAEMGRCTLVDAVTNKMAKEKGGDAWEKINKNLKLSKKK